METVNHQGLEFTDGPVVKILPSNTESVGSVPGQGTRSHMLQLRVLMPQLIPGIAKHIHK